MIWFDALTFKAWVTVNSVNISRYRILFHSPGHEKQQSLRYLTAELPYLGTGFVRCFWKLCQATVASFQHVVGSEFSLPLFHLWTSRVFLARKIKKSSLPWQLLLQLIRPRHEWLEGKCYEVVMICNDMLWFGDMQYKCVHYILENLLIMDSCLARLPTKSRPLLPSKLLMWVWMPWRNRAEGVNQSTHSREIVTGPIEVRPRWFSCVFTMNQLVQTHEMGISISPTASSIGRNFWPTEVTRSLNMSGALGRGRFHFPFL